MTWWDGDMRKQTNRTLLGWSVASGPAKRRERHEKTSRRGRAWKDRRLAEMVEGIPSSHDQRALSTGPFGRLRLWRWNDYWARPGRSQSQKQYQPWPWTRDKL